MATTVEGPASSVEHPPEIHREIARLAAVWAVVPIPAAPMSPDRRARFRQPDAPPLPMTEARNTILPPHLRVDDRRQAERVAAIAEPRFPATGTARISALLAEARARESEERHRAARARRQPIRAD